LRARITPRLVFDVAPGSAEWRRFKPISSSGLLLHGTGHRPRDREVDVSLIYGDYYFVEALLPHRAWFTPECDDGIDNDDDQPSVKNSC
jgi:hypothetical protein